LNQKNDVCKSCPLLVNGDPKYYAEPAKLNETVGKYYRDESLHPCHSEPDTFCTGFLAFIGENHPNGFKGYKMARLAIFMGLLDCSKVPSLKVFNSVEEMLQAHESRAISNKNFSETVKLFENNKIEF
jgi:hypothetical protein